MQAATFNPNLMVADIRSSIQFYQTYLGFSIIQATPETGVPDWVMLQSGPSVLMLQAAPNIRAEYAVLAERSFGGSLTFYVHVADIAALFEQMNGHVPIVKPLHKTPYGATEFAVADPDGFILTLAQDQP